MSQTSKRPAPVHGVVGYIRYGCRCETCRAANTARAKVQRAARALRVAAGDPAVPHGTPGGYTNWDCRCDQCRKANSESCMTRKRGKRNHAANPA